jgi:hypothetical protein
MKLDISEEECRSMLMVLRTKTPPDNISPIFVKTQAAEEVLKEIYRLHETVSQGQDAGFLIIKADRGAGKTAIIHYLKEELQDDVIFVHVEKSPVSAENLFRSFINDIGKQKLLEIISDLFSDPLELYETLSEGGHNGTVIALAGLLESNEDCWSYLSSGSPSLVKLECGLRMVRNIRDNNALEALSTVINLLAKEKPVIFAIDELESAFNELKESQKSKLGDLFVNLINKKGLRNILFLFAATDPVYERCFLTTAADVKGLKRRVKDATAILGLPTPEEVSLMLKKILALYPCAYDEVTFSASELDQIIRNYDEPSTMPNNVVAYALKKGGEKVDIAYRYTDLRDILSKKGKGTPVSSTTGKGFEDAIGILIEYIPNVEFYLAQTDAIDEGKWLKQNVSGLRKIQKYLDWSFRIGSTNFWVETCITKKKDSVIPTRKALAVFGKTLYNEGSIGLFITHNYNRFSVGRGAGRIVSKYPELRKRVGIINLDKERYELVMGILDMEEEDIQKAAKYISEKIGLTQMIKDLRGGKHFFW